MAFAARYTDRAAVMRPKPGTLGAGGRPEYEQLKDGDGNGIFLRCRLEERGRVIFDARGQQRQTDATLMYMPGSDAAAQDGDLLVVNDQAYEVVAAETMRLPFGGGSHSRLSLVRSKIAVPEVAP